MTLESIEKAPTFRTEGNFTYCRNIKDLRTALGLHECIAEDKKVDASRCTLVFDFDGPLADSIALQAIVGYSLKRLQQLHSFLIRYPRTSVSILTSRHAYGWGLGIKWLRAIQEVLVGGTNYKLLSIPMHSLAYDPMDDLSRKIAYQAHQDCPNRLVIRGAGKDMATRILEVILGYRTIGSFIKHDVLKIHPELVSERLYFALSTLFAAREKMGGGIVTIIDDGVMLPAVKALAPDLKNVHVVYIHMTESKVGSIPMLLEGALGILATRLRNIRYRQLRRPPNP